MQVGNGQKPVLRPIERTPRVGEKRNSGQDNEIALAPQPDSAPLGSTHRLLDQFIGRLGQQRIGCLAMHGFPSDFEQHGNRQR